jgi:hypothetical protein
MRQPNPSWSRPGLPEGYAAHIAQLKLTYLGFTKVTSLTRRVGYIIVGQLCHGLHGIRNHKHSFAISPHLKDTWKTHNRLGILDKIIQF